MTAETTINGHEITVQADHPAGTAIAGRVTLTYWTAADKDGAAVGIKPTISRTGGASKIQWQGKIPTAATYPVTLTFGARNLCGSSVHQMTVDDPEQPDRWVTL